VAAAIAGAFLALAGAGCSHPFDRRAQALDPSDAVVPYEPWPPRGLAMFEGRSGRVLTWADLYEGLAWADVVVVGETHDNLRAHELQRAIVEDLVNAYPDVALSLEMLETDEQPLVDAYLAGEIDLDAFESRTGSRDWGEKDSWRAFYQPSIDLVRDAGGRVVAANAPRRLVRLARTDGFAALAALPPEERRLAAIPRPMTGGEYRERFDRFMSGGDPAALDAEARARIDATYRAQQVWDATMARAIADALDGGATKVVHLVGSFHSDWDGGLVDQLRRRKPFARILTVSVVPVDARRLREEDRRRADAVVYAAKPSWPPAGTMTEAAGESPGNPPETP